VVFFFVQGAVGFHSLSNDLDSHLHGQNYSTWLKPWAESVLADRGTTVAEYAPVFDNAVSVNAKALAVIMVPLFALLAWLLSPLRGRPAVAHFVLALHFGAFFLLWLGIAIPLIGAPISIGLASFGAGSYADGVLAWTAMIPVWAWYAYTAFGRVYGGPAWARALKSMVFAVLLIGAIRVYRLIVFFVTFYTA
jgi:hypothetical protein